MKRFVSHISNKELDRDLELNYFGARYYQPEFPRFLSPDPVGGTPEVPISWNRYLYCRNDPINHIDPDGNYIRKADYDWVHVVNELVEMTRALFACKTWSEMYKLAYKWHGPGGLKDYKAQHGWENLIGPGTGYINDRFDPDGNRMRVKYWEVPGSGNMDPSEYGNFLTGYTVAIIQFLTGSSEPYVLMVFAGRAYSYLPDLFAPAPAVDESAHDELSSPYYNTGFTYGMMAMATSADNESMWGPKNHPPGYKGSKK